MTSYQVWTLFGLAAVALGLFYVGAAVTELRKDVSEIWKRMPRLD